MSESLSALWPKLCKEAEQSIETDADTATWLQKMILQPPGARHALATLLQARLTESIPASPPVDRWICESFEENSEADHAAGCDLLAVRERDSACDNLLQAFLLFKGFHALQTYRTAFFLWNKKKHLAAQFLQNRCAEVFSVDIHPAAHIGSGIMMDHADGIVIGETAQIGNNVSIMQEVTLGGTGKQKGDRHPKIEEGVLISAGAKIIGNIRIGAGAKIGAGSVVLQEVPPHTTVVGVPAKAVGHLSEPAPALVMDHSLDTEASTKED